jgi:cell division protein FtsZ
MPFEYVGNEKSAKIKVIGVGGAGGNAINNMIASNLEGVQFIAANTDAQALEISQAELKMQLGGKLTQGLGAGSNPHVGRDAAIENEEDFRKILEKCHMVFITAGLGGGTGTGAAPIIAKVCKDMGVLCVAVVTKPFSFEGKKRIRQAEEGLNELKEFADTIIIIPNDRLRCLAPKNAKLIEMFRKADDVLLQAVRGITDLIMKPGLVNLDFADVRTTMSKAGTAIMGIGISSGEKRAVEAAERAISHPLLEDVSISGAKGVLMNITSTSELTMEEMAEAAEAIHKEVGDEAEIIWGQAIDEELGEELRITVIATGISKGPVSVFSGPYKNNSNKVLRGKIRDVTPSDIKIAVDYDQPTFIRNQEIKKNKDLLKGIIIDNDLDVPTFMRRSENAASK